MTYAPAERDRTMATQKNETKTLFGKQSKPFTQPRFLQSFIQRSTTTQLDNKPSTHKSASTLIFL